MSLAFTPLLVYESQTEKFTPLLALEFLDLQAPWKKQECCNSSEEIISGNSTWKLKIERKKTKQNYTRERKQLQ